MPTIKVENLSKYYFKNRRLFRRKPTAQEIGIDNVNFTIEQGEFVFVIGSSGAGKSTLLNLLSGREKPNKGSIFINDQDLSVYRRGKSKKLPLLIGYVSQHHELVRGMTVRDNLVSAAKAGRKRFDDEDEEFEDRVNKVLGLTGLLEAKSRYPGELTAGECRRVELARALINSPPILVLDEVIANLDPDSMWDVFLLLQEINRRGTTVIMATHNSRYVNMMHRRVITLVDGRIYSDEDKGRYGEVSKKKNANGQIIL